MVDEFFEWDEVKNEANRKKHGLSFEEAIQVFNDQFTLESPDETNSWDEARWIALGMLPDWRIVVVVYVERENRIRIISAREATRSERGSYEERARR